MCSAQNLRVLVYDKPFPPYYFTEGAPQKGIVREVFDALAAETGDHFEYVRYPFMRALHEFEKGRVDIEPMASPGWRKNSSVPGVYSIPFAVSEEIVLFRKDSAVPDCSPESLLGRTIGVVSGYNYPAFDSFFESGRITAYPLPNETRLVQMLLAGRLDQALMNSDFARYQMKIRNAADKLVVSKPCSALDMMIRVHPDKKDVLPRFNRALRKLMENGTIKRIYDRYR